MAAPKTPHDVNFDRRHFFENALMRVAATGRMRAFASLVLVATVYPASPAFTQTANAPFGDVAHHVVRVDGVRFHYVTAGSGEPVVLLPGWPGSMSGKKSSDKHTLRVSNIPGIEIPK